MVTINDIHLVDGEQLPFELEEVGHLVEDFVSEHKPDNCPYPVEILRSISSIAQQCFTAAFALHLHYSRINRKETSEEVARLEKTC